MKKKLFQSVILIFLLISSVWAQNDLLQEEQDFLLAGKLAGEKMFDLAALQYKKFAELYPSSQKAPEALFYAAVNYEKCDSVNVAAQTYLKLILKYPESSFLDQAQFNRADVLAKFGMHKESAIAFSRLKLFSPESNLIPEAQIHAAEQYIKANDLVKASDAANYFMENFSLHPKRFEARYLLAKIRISQQKYDLANTELEKLESERIEDDLVIRSKMLKADLYKKTGRFALVDSVYYEIINSGFQHDSVGVVGISLANSFRNKNMNEKAIEVLNKVLKQPLNARIKTRVNILQADCLFETRDYQKALNIYKGIDLNQLSENEKNNYFFKIAVTCEKLDDIGAALGYLEKIQGESVSGLLNQRMLLKTADLLTKQGNAAKAVYLLQQDLQQPNLYKKDEVLYFLAQIQEKQLKDYTGAKNSFTGISSICLNSPYLDDAQIKTAQLYEKENNNVVALSEYKRFLSLYPGSEFYDQVLERVEYLEKFSQTGDTKDSELMTSLLLNNSFSVQNSSLIQNWLKSLIFEKHQYSLAMDLIKKVLSAGENTGLTRDELLYSIIYCQSALFEKNQYLGETAKAKSYLDNSLETFDLLRESFVSSQWTEKSGELVLNSYLENISEPSIKITLLDSVINTTNFLNDNDNSSCYKVNLAELLLKHKSDFLSLQKAVTVCQDVIFSGEQSACYPEALYYTGTALQKLALTDSSADFLERYTQLNDPKYIVPAKFQLAQLYEKDRPERAKQLYQEIITYYFYSQYADQAKSSLAQLFIKEKKYNEAEELLKDTAPDILPGMESFFSLTLNEDHLWYLTLAEAKSSSNTTAIEKFNSFLKLTHDKNLQAKALYEAGSIADEMNQWQVALGFWKELVKNHPSDTLAQQAQTRSADIFYRNEKYEQASGLYSKMMNDLSGELQQEAFKRYVICEYKLGHLAKADQLANQFNKQYDDKNSEAEFVYQAGMFQIAQKNFNTAEKLLKNVSDKFKDTPAGGHGELGLARLYVVLNKTDEALKILTNIPEKYEDPEIVASAYVYLADFYYKNRQLESCIAASQRVMDLQKDGPLRAKAMDLLIDAFDDLGLRDRAIALQRAYIAQYSDSPDILARKVTIGAFLYYLKDYDRSIKYLHDLKPFVSAEEEPEVQYWIAEAYNARGDIEQAIVGVSQSPLSVKTDKIALGHNSVVSGR